MFGITETDGPGYHAQVLKSASEPGLPPEPYDPNGRLMTRREKIVAIRASLGPIACNLPQHASGSKTRSMEYAAYSAWLELSSDTPNLPYVHNLLARAWGLPELKAHG